MPLSLWPSYLNICVSAYILLLTLGIAIYSWDHRSLPSARRMAFLALWGSLWALAYLLELFSPALSAKLLFENVQYLALSLVLVFYLLLALAYTRQIYKVSVLFWFLLLLEPLSTQLVLWLDPLLHWFRKTSFVQTSGYDYPGMLNSTTGPWFWVNLIYTVLFFVVVLIFLLIGFFRAPKWARSRIWYLVVAVFIPLCMAVASIPEWIMNWHDYLLLLSVAISMLIVAWGVFHTRLLDIVPIARETLLDQVKDAVIVLDASAQVVEVNRAGENQFKSTSSAWVGKLFTSLLPEFSDITLDKTAFASHEKQLAITISGVSSTYDLRISPLLTDMLTHAGWLVTFHDISSHIQEEEKLRSAQDKMQQAFLEAQNRQEELSIIRNMTETLNQSNSIRQALLPAMRQISDLYGNVPVWVVLTGDENENGIWIAYRANDPTTPLSFFPRANDLPACMKVYLEEGGFTSKVVKCNCEKDLFPERTILTTHLAFTLKVGEKVLGFLNVHFAPDQLVDENLNALTLSLCNSLSVTLDRVNLFKAEHEQKRLAIAQQQIVAKLTSSRDFDAVLDLLMEQVARLVPNDCSSIMLIGETESYIARSRGYDYLGSNFVQAMQKWKFVNKDTYNISRILNTKSTLFIEDVLNNPNWVKMDPRMQFHSWLGAPILINDQVAAVFSLEKKEKGYYSQKDADRLSSFCSAAALAFQNAEYFAEIKKRVREFESLQTTMNDITSELDLKQLLREITKRSISLLGSSTGSLGLLNKETNCVDIVVGFSPEGEFAGEVIPLGKGATGRVAESHEPMVLDDYPAWPGHLPRMVTVFPHAMVQVPLLAGSELLGVLGVGDENPSRKYTEEDVRLLSLFAQQATIGIRNARLYARARLQAEEAETLREASKIVTSELEQKQALPLILDQLGKVVPFDTASVLLENEGELEVVEGKGFSTDSPFLGIHIDLKSAQPGAVVFNNQTPLIVHNIAKEYPDFHLLNQLQVCSWIGVPLKYGERMLGILALDSFEADRYDEDQARLVAAFAGHVAIALENVRLYQSALQSAKRLATLYKLSQRISANLQPDEVYHAIHKATKDLMACDSFILSLYDEKTQTINDVYFVDHSIPQKLTSRPMGVGLASKVITEKKTVFYNHFNINMVKRTNAVLVGEDKDESVVRSLIIVPLKLGKSVRGILSTQSYSADAYSQEDKETLELLASHAVIALENSHLFSEVQELAITDSLTKINNRRRFFDLAEQEFERSRRYDRPLSLIMLDIDHFKRVNDTYGHAAGDTVLEQLAQLCQKSLREVDVFARYGGEEFVILLPETTSQEAQLTAERIRQLVARTPIKVGEDSLTITISFGIVELDKTCKNVEELLDRSDQAMYISKRNGRNRVSIWEASSTIEK